MYSNQSTINSFIHHYLTLHFTRAVQPDYENILDNMKIFTSKNYATYSNVVIVWRDFLSPVLNTTTIIKKIRWQRSRQYNLKKTFAFRKTD